MKQRNNGRVRKQKGHQFRIHKHNAPFRFDRADVRWKTERGKQQAKYPTTFAPFDRQRRCACSSTSGGRFGNQIYVCLRKAHTPKNKSSVPQKSNLVIPFLSSSVLSIVPLHPWSHLKGGHPSRQLASHKVDVCIGPHSYKRLRFELPLSPSLSLAVAARRKRARKCCLSSARQRPAHTASAVSPNRRGGDCLPFRATHVFRLRAVVARRASVRPSSWQANQKDSSTGQTTSRSLRTEDVSVFAREQQASGHPTQVHCSVVVSVPGSR